MKIATRQYWDSILQKLLETLISVKMWMLFVTIFFSWKLLQVFIEMKNHAFQNPEQIALISDWSNKILDITLAMFTGVIVVITLSREVFKHARLSDDTESEEKNTMI